MVREIRSVNHNYYLVVWIDMCLACLVVAICLLPVANVGIIWGLEALVPLSSLPTNSGFLMGSVSFYVRSM